MKYLLVCLALVLASCGGQDQPDPAPAPAAPTRPITEIVQTLNIGMEQTWDSTLAVLNQRGIDTELLYKELGRITTAWVPMEDKMCDLAYSEQAPLSCRTQYSIQLQPLTSQATAVTIRYVEKCIGREELELVCPDSNAERRMVAIIEDLKALVGVKY